MALCAIADAHYRGQRHTAADAVVVDLVHTPTPFPDAVDDAFADAVAAVVEACARRLSERQRLHFGADVAHAFLVSDGAALPPIPRAASTSTADPVPRTPWALTVPQELVASVPGSLRVVFDQALVTKAAGLGLAVHGVVSAPRLLPHPASLTHTRHLDEALVAVAAALVHLGAAGPALLASLRWLRAALAAR